MALSAFDSFCRGAARGQFPQLRDRDNLWPLLVKITARKASDLVRHDLAAKRGAGAVQGESAWSSGPDSDQRGIEQVVGDEPSPELAARLAEEYRGRMEALGNDTLRKVALWKMEGYTNDELAARLGCGPHTVEHRVRVIRSV